MKYGLIGEHLPHSFSKEIHAKIAPYEYELHEIAAEELDDFMKKRDFNAINVTIPYKQAVIPYLSYIDERAQKIGAVNTIVNREGKLYGYNTDFFGMQALIEKVGLTLKDKKVLILGTGGTSKTAKAVAEALLAKNIIVVGRKEKDGIVSYETAYADHADAEIIINTTPCGMYPYPDGNDSVSNVALDIHYFQHLEGVIDAVYNPLRPNLVMNAMECNIRAEGGLYMLVAQAIAAAEIFMDTKLDHTVTEKIFNEIRAQKENIVLTGMPGSGKTTVGKQLAQSLGRPFYDTDDEIIAKTGKQISDIFAEVGNDGFRKIETEVIKDLCARTIGAVIATGGGAILKDENVRALKRNGRLYFLNRPIEYIVPTSDRPLALDRAALEARFAERYDRYLSTADVEIKTDETIEHSINTVTEDFFNENTGNQRS